MTSKPLPPHGSLSRHKWHGCKCRTCYDGYNEWARQHKALKRGDTYNALIDAEPVRQHLLRLEAAGISTTKVAKYLGCHPSNVISFVKPTGAGRPRRRRTTPEHAARILAVTVADLLPGTVDATGTRRRIQALAAIGWPLRHLGPIIGVSPAWVDDLVKKDVTSGQTAHAVRQAYERLSRSNPERHGVSKVSAQRARRRAANLRWPTPKYWAKFPDAIDDPHFTPEYGMTKPQRLAEEAVWMVTVAGVPRTEAAARLGLTFGEVDEALTRNDMRKAA
ncbi:hypothetical protein ACIQWN_28725 [Streptomyces vinaceus]|uniref:hypothetical protein n=1 Tax=Streptomyces vinaceus TaxID=1960 RepID=UPI00381C033F